MECIHSQKGDLRDCEELLKYSDHIGCDFDDFGSYIRRTSLSDLYPNDELKQEVYSRVLLANAGADLNNGSHGITVVVSSADQHPLVTVSMDRPGNLRYSRILRNNSSAILLLMLL